MQCKSGGKNMATKRYKEYIPLQKLSSKDLKWKHNKKAYDGNITRVSVSVARHQRKYVINTFRECKNLPTRH
jgi:hypothetical protein